MCSTVLCVSVGNVVVKDGGVVGSVCVCVCGCVCAVVVEWYQAAGSTTKSKDDISNKLIMLCINHHVVNIIIFFIH